MPLQETYREDTGETVVSTIETLNDAGRAAAAAKAPGEGDAQPSAVKPQEAPLQKPAEGGISSIPDKKNEDIDGLISTTDMVPTQTNDLKPIPGSEEKKETSPDEKGKGKPEEKGKEPGTDDDKPFHEHPRFQELMTEREKWKEEALIAKGKLEAMGTQGKQDTGEEEKDYADILDMDDDEIRDQMDEDPKKFLANLTRQIHHEVTNAVTTQLTTENQKKDLEKGVKNTFDSYADENPSFDKMWKSGEIRQFMDKNPGHNALSAHMALTMKDKMKEEIGKAVNEAIEKERANYKAKGHASVLGEGPSRAAADTGTGVPPELQDTKKFGGLVRSITDRLLQERAGK